MVCSPERTIRRIPPQIEGAPCEPRLEDPRARSRYNPPMPDSTTLAAGADVVKGRWVVVDGNLTTSRGPGTALEFALELAAQLAGRDKADQLRAAMLVE